MSRDDEFILDRRAVREVDRAAIEEFGVPSIVLMENAALGLTEVVLQRLESVTRSPHRVLIVCGKGNNGGDGYALARHLSNAGVDTVIAPLGSPRPEGDAGINHAICLKMDIPHLPLQSIVDTEVYDLIIDAIFGTGLDRAIEGQAAEAVEWINASNRPVIAVDVPSGLDCDTGEPLGPTVKAEQTVTFVATKKGFLNESAHPYVGQVHVRGIGAPAELLDWFG